MKTPLGMEVDLGPGHIVLDRDPAAPPAKGAKGAEHPLFSAHVYCGHCRPSQLLLSSCTNCRPKNVTVNWATFGLFFIGRWAEISEHNWQHSLLCQVIKTKAKET